MLNYNNIFDISLKAETKGKKDAKEITLVCSMYIKCLRICT